MPSVTYNLFRVKFIHSQQRGLFDLPKTAQEIFELAIAEFPSIEVGNRWWQIGNFERITDVSGYFRLGKTTTASATMFDPETKTFVDVSFEHSPYTHIVYDSHFGFVAIAANPKLSRAPTGIANKLEDVLASTAAVTHEDVRVEVSPISEPDSFITAIKKASKVVRFTAFFTGPNPFDADELFQKPLAVYAKHANAVKGKAEIEGEELNKDVLIEVTRSTAATGNEATARVHATKDSRPKTIKLSGNPLGLNVGETSSDPASVHKKALAAYEKVRGNAHDSHN